MPTTNAPPAREVHDALIVGAGPAGLGVAAHLARIGIDATVVDRDGIGASFLRWPEGMRLITPSFTGNQFGAVDLNAITPDTSPALSLLEEHPTGEQYARYLQMVAKLEELDVREDVAVTDVRPSAEHGVDDPDLLAVEVGTDGPWWARTVVWAAGEFAYPRTDGFPGAERCIPTVDVRSWPTYPGEHVTVIGGYESGIDAAVNLVADGRQVTVLDREAPWLEVDPDPSRTLSPYTRGRLREAELTDRLTLLADAEVTGVTAVDQGYAVDTADGRRVVSDAPPLLAIGFEGSLTQVRRRFAFTEHGHVELTETADESTVVPGLYLAGPMLAHREAIFCFIYKFRQRAAIVAADIARRLGVDPSPLEALREQGFYLDDLTCCDDCAC